MQQGCPDAPQQRAQQKAKNVISAQPSDMHQIGLKEGIWICSFDEFKLQVEAIVEGFTQMQTDLN